MKALIVRPLVRPLLLGDADDGKIPVPVIMTAG